MCSIQLNKNLELLIESTINPDFDYPLDFTEIENLFEDDTK